MKASTNQKPYVMSIAGFDPTAGAGILADIKCFEQNDAYGFGICSALTIQTDRDFLKNEWLDADQIIAQIAPIYARFKVTAVKIGLIKSIDVLLEVIDYLKKNQREIKIILDPVLKATAGYEFHDWQDGLKQLLPVLKQIQLVTPNYLEMFELSAEEEVFSAARDWSFYCPVLLKGGHIKTHMGTDFLYEHGRLHELRPDVTKVYQKHGSGCVLSAAITAALAKGYTLKEACIYAKKYTECFLNSNESLLGYHKLINIQL